MNQKTAARIFKEHNLGKVDSVSKIEIGFTNQVYLVNDQFILKVCEDESNEQKFEREVFFYNFFKGKIPIPKIKVFDKSKKIYAKLFMVYPKIEGHNLYSKWHLLNNDERKVIIKQLCDILKTINQASFEEFKNKFKIDFSNNWHDKVLGEIQALLKKVEAKKLLSCEFIQVIKQFINDNHHVLKEQKLALVYWDSHFDNILVRDTKIVGILDFERTEISSIDFVLDMIK
ncbi:MAG: phosphotransferase [Candidatus Moranbacteria bacterium]|nr:phosphotransferase [Candidatus Moranbacteria bacterium]